MGFIARTSIIVEQGPVIQLVFKLFHDPDTNAQLSHIFRFFREHTLHTTLELIEPSFRFIRELSCFI